MGKEMGFLTTTFADIQCPDLYLEQVDLAVVDIERANHRHHIVHAAKSQVFPLNTTRATGTFYNGDDIAGGGCINYILQDICRLYKPGCPMNEGGSEDEAEKKSKDGRFHDQKIYFTVAPVDSMVTVPPVGTAIGATSKPSTMGLLVVRPSGIKL